MSWRTVVITGNAKLDYKMDYMVVRKSDMTTRIYIGEIGMLIIESTAISLTTMLLCELTKHKIKIVFCDEKHNGVLPVKRTIKNNKFLYRQPCYGWRYFMLLLCIAYDIPLVSLHVVFFEVVHCCNNLCN